MRGLRYPRLILERLGGPLALTQTLQVLVSSCLPQQIFNFSSKLLTRFEKKQPKNSLHMPRSIRTTRKIENTFITVASGEINLQVSDLICHVAKVRAARSALSMADVIHFFYSI